VWWEQTREHEGEKDDDSSPTRLANAAYMPDLAGTLEVLTTPAGVGVDSAPTWGPTDGPTSFSVVRLKGRIADSGQWTLGGLVSENESATWRMAAEFLFAPGSGHEIQAATGYGTRYIRPVGGSQDQRSCDDRCSRESGHARDDSRSETVRRARSQRGCRASHP
jgi:hypothetical protein